MGRQLKRVPLDFDWPLNIRWIGYVSPSAPDDLPEEYEEKWYDAWYDHGEFDPPKGEGWQMWENTSEGSPISPVFATKEELATWLFENNASVFGRETATYDEWIYIINQEWIPSMIIAIPEES